MAYLQRRVIIIIGVTSLPPLGTKNGSKIFFIIKDAYGP